MKKNIIFVSIILVIILLVLTLYIYNTQEKTEYFSCTGVIINIYEDTNQIVIETISDEEPYYIVPIQENTTIKDINNIQIDISELNIGDTVYVVSRKKEMLEDFQTSRITLYKVNLIQVMSPSF